MSKTIQVFSGTGNVGKDPELKYSKNDKAYCFVSLAFDCGWGDNKSTTWLTAKFFNKPAEIVAEYARKGGQMAVTGEIQISDYEAQGETRRSVALMVDKFTMISGSRDQANPNTGGGDNPTHGKSSDDFEDDIPF